MLDKKIRKIENVSDREILRRLAEIFGAHPDDVVRSLERFKREISGAKIKLGETK